MNIFTKKNIEILRFLEKEEAHLRDISDRLKISPGKVHSAVKLFKKNNLIEERREKNRVIISLKKDNPILFNLFSVIEEKRNLKFNLAKRKATSRKGENGKVLIIGGSIDYVGAPALAGIAALRAGADLVTIATAEKAAWAINELCPDLITKKLKGDYLTLKNFDEIKELIENADVLLIGPGIGKRKETNELVIKLLKITKNKVVDADAINSVNLKEITNAIITPHHGEFNALLKNNKNLNEANLQKNLNSNIILLKGPIDKIISKDKIKYNRTGNEGMTKGGTGDVLAGLAAGLIAQGNSLFDSAYIAAYINGRAGDILKSRMGYGFLSSDLARELPEAIKEVQHG